MKKTLYLLAILAFLAPTLTFASFDASLKYGSRGDAVSELQDFLQDQNDYSGKVDGSFGLGTLKAVKAFQAANNLDVDGYFGKASHGVAQTLLAADLKASDDAEQAETGTVSAPVVQPQPVTDTGTQSAISALSQQVQTLTQVTQQIVSNATPIGPQPPSVTQQPIINTPSVVQSIPEPELLLSLSPDFTNQTALKSLSTKIGSFIVNNPLSENESYNALYRINGISVTVPPNMGISNLSLQVNSDSTNVQTSKYSVTRTDFYFYTDPQMYPGKTMKIDVFADTTQTIGSVTCSINVTGINSGVISEPSLAGQVVTIQ